jgi:hypothetical protein
VVEVSNSLSFDMATALTGHYTLGGTIQAIQERRSARTLSEDVCVLEGNTETKLKRLWTEWSNGLSLLWW